MSTNPVVSVRSVQDDNRQLCLVWCPGCDRQHSFWVQDPSKPPYGREHVWDFDRDQEHPTFSPSLLVHPDARPPAGTEYIDGYRPQVRCHSFLRAGRWEFLADSEHPLAGQTVDMVPLPDWLVKPS